jgi:hypothetical protein
MSTPTWPTAPGPSIKNAPAYAPAIVVDPESDDSGEQDDTVVPVSVRRWLDRLAKEPPEAVPENSTKIMNEMNHDDDDEMMDPAVD